MSKKTCVIYKGDLKFTKIDSINNDEFDTEFESEQVKEIYNDYKSKTKIEIRIKDSELENYQYLDLSKLELTDELLDKLFKLDKIKNILKKILFLDLSNNQLTKYPNLTYFSNIIYLNIGYNMITDDIDDNNIEELSCEFNKIKSISSSSIKKLSASENMIKKINVPSVTVLIISKNKINYIPSYVNLEYLECIDNEIVSIDNMVSLQEIYIANNKLENIQNMPKLKILNCANNPIEKIGYIKSLEMIVCTTPNVSSKYNITNIGKIKKDYLIYLESNK